MPVASELSIETAASAMQMADAMFGSGITITGASHTGVQGASGIYSNGDTVAPGLTPSDSGVILSTGNAQDVTNSSGDVNTSARTTTRLGSAGDDDLTALAGAQTFVAAVFEAEFIPAGSTQTMQFVFSSEEYLEWVGTGGNDVVGVWVNGEQADMTIGTGDISIDNINDEANKNLYVDNHQNYDVYNTEMDGFTITLILTAPVNPGEANTIKIGIADAGDDRYDSNLLIAGDSIQTALVAGDDAVTVTEGETETLDVLSNDTRMPGATLTVTHINGQPVALGSTVTLANGEQVTLNTDGTFTVARQADVDGPETTTFTYTVAENLGDTDTGVVEMTTVPRFVAGTLIDTLGGPIPVESLKLGAQVRTRDHGFQPLGWTDRSARVAEGGDAPAVFAVGALGAHDEIELSPCHRVLVASNLADLIFGSAQVLIKAKDLNNGTAIRRHADGNAVTYVHLLFDQHEIVCGNGLFSESYHPGCETLEGFDADARAEILQVIGGT